MNITPIQNGGHYPVEQTPEKEHTFFEDQQPRRREEAALEGEQPRLPKEQADPRDVARFEKHYEAFGLDKEAQRDAALHEMRTDEAIEEDLQVEERLEDEVDVDEIDDAETATDDGDDEDENPYKQRERHHEGRFHQQSDPLMQTQQRAIPADLAINMIHGEMFNPYQQEQSQGNVAQEKAIEDPGAFVNEVADKLLTRLLVSDPKSEKREVRLSFNEDLLPGVEVQMEHNHGTLQLSLTAADPEQREALEAKRESLQQHLSEALGDEVEVLLAESFEEDAESPAYGY